MNEYVKEPVLHRHTIHLIFLFFAVISVSFFLGFIFNTLWDKYEISNFSALMIDGKVYAVKSCETVKVDK